MLVFGQHNADFSADVTSGCAPLVVKMTDLSDAGVDDWEWTTTAGLSSEDQNPTFVFPEPGIFEITLTSSNGGDSDTETKSQYIRVNPGLTSDFTASTTNGCVPLGVDFSDLSVPGSAAITDWFWSFSNGETSTDRNPSVNFTDANQYDILLKVTDANGCESTTIKSEYIIADGPVADFLFDTIACSIPADIMFLNTSTGNDLEYEWDFGNGQTSTVQIPPAVSYSEFDTLPVSLIITESLTGCADTTVKSIYLRNYEAKIGVLNASCDQDGYTFSLTDSTLPSPEVVIWSFQDGDQRFTSNVTKTFAPGSEQTIVLTSKIGQQCTNSDTITYKPPGAVFSFPEPITCDSVYDVTFTNLSTGTHITSYKWDFSDTVLLNEFEPTHSFTVPPVSVEISLEVSDEYGCLASRSGTLNFPFPDVDFTTNNLKFNGCAPLSIDFIDSTNTSTSTIKSVWWDFGDPSSGSANNDTDTLTSHIFNQAGEYDITYAVELDNGCADTIVKKNYIKVGVLPNTNTITDDLTSDTICYGEMVNYAANTVYDDPTIFGDYFCWAFESDGTPKLSGETPSSLCPPTFSGFNPIEKYVNSQIPQHLYENFEYVNDTNINGMYYMGKVKPDTGAFTTHLVSGFNGCYAETTKPIYVKPVAAMLGFAFSEPEYVLTACDTSKTVGIYNSSVNYDSLMYFRIVHIPTGDTLIQLNENDTTFFKFDRPGVSEIQIGVFNKDLNCGHETVRNFNVIERNDSLEMLSSSCTSELIQAVNKTTFSEGSVSQKSWFLNGITSFLLDPDVADDTFRLAPIDTGWNVFTLQTELSVQDEVFGPYFTPATCRYSYSDSVYVEGTKVEIELDTNLVCGKDSVTIRNISVGTSSFTSMEWTIKGDPSVIGTDDSIRVAYDTARFIIYQLKIESDFGCVDSGYSDSLEISRPVADFAASDTIACLNEPLTFSNKSTGNNLDNTWTIEGSSYINVDAVHSSTVVGKYDAKLHIADIHGCEDSITKPNYVRVADFPVAAFQTLDVIVECPPFSVQFLDTSLKPGTKWKWEIGDGGTSETQSYLHTFFDPGTFDVKLTTENDEGCVDELVKPGYITVLGPSAVATVDDTILCAPDSAKFNMVFTNAHYYVWSYGDGISESFPVVSDTDSVAHSYLVRGKHDPVLTILDTNDCAVELKTLPSIYVDSVQVLFEGASPVSCGLDSVRFENNTNTQFQSTFTWDFGDGNSSSDSLGINNYLAENTYNVKLVAQSSIGCIDSLIIPYEVYLGPGESFSINQEHFCVPISSDYVLEYSDPSFTPDEAYFEVDGVKYPGDSVSIAFNTAKKYDMAYTIVYGNNSCEVDSVFEVQYYDTVYAAFSFSPQLVSLTSPDVAFSSSSKNATIWEWDFGDGGSQNTENPVHVYTREGRYTIQLIASNAGGCPDTAVATMPVAPMEVITFPNAFSPNGDGYNDEFGILSAGQMDILNFEIYNRWGNLVYKTNFIEDKWDGRYNGVMQNFGTYVYYVKGRTEEGQILEYRGSFSLVK